MKKLLFTFLEVFCKIIFGFSFSAFCDVSEKSLQNLVTFGQLPPEQRRALARKAAAVSAQVRKQRKTMREALKQALLMMEDDSGSDGYAQVAAALISKAINGDVRAIEVLRDSIGEKPATVLQGGDGPPVLPPALVVNFVEK